jgi:hypothetical protein
MRDVGLVEEARRGLKNLRLNVNVIDAARARLVYGISVGLIGACSLWLFPSQFGVGTIILGLLLSISTIGDLDASGQILERDRLRKEGELSEDQILAILRRGEEWGPASARKEHQISRHTYEVWRHRHRDELMSLLDD